MGWTEPFVAPENSPWEARGEPSLGVYRAASGSAMPPDWHVGEWTIDIDETKFGEKVEKYQDAGLDIMILVSDYHSRRGTGKSTLSIELAEWLDQTDEGLTPSKATMSAEEFVEAYVTEPQGSGMIFDEAEAEVNARDAMTNINKEINKTVGMGRIGEKYSVWNMPDANTIDKELRAMAHFWVLVTRRGRARIYELDNNPFEQKTYPSTLCDITWSKVPKDHPIYRKLHSSKQQELRDEGTKHIPADEHQKQLEKAREEAKKEARDKYIYQLYHFDLLNQPQIASAFDLSQNRVSQIYREMKKEREADS